MAPAKKTILIIEDEPHIVLGLKDALEFEGFRVVSAQKGRDGVALAKHEKPDAIVLDLMLPDINGYKVCEEVRRWDPFVPVIMLTARSQEVDKIRGLDAGADDSVTKPFSVGELIARIRAILRRLDATRADAGDGADAAALPEPIRRGRLTMDPTRHAVQWNGAAVSLTVTEFLILEALAQRPGVIKSRNQLMDAAYSDDIYVDDRTIDSHIKRLRRKFRQVDPQFKSIETLYGAGYSFADA